MMTLLTFFKNTLGINNEETIGDIVNVVDSLNSSYLTDQIIKKLLVVKRKNRLVFTLLMLLTKYIFPKIYAE